MTRHFNVSTYALQNLNLYLCSDASHTLKMRMSIKIKGSGKKRDKATGLTESCSDRNCNVTARDHEVKM